jgi:hypothetical protein
VKTIISSASALVLALTLRLQRTTRERRDREARARPARPAAAGTTAPVARAERAMRRSASDAASFDRAAARRTGRRRPARAVLLDRRGSLPGVIDGTMGENVRQADRRLRGSPNGLR